ncbi:MAG TPA: hypothetical protein VGL65_03260 [Gemmatimonadales bacterium]
MNGRSGAALVVVLFAFFLISSLSLVALAACAARIRLAADNRWATEAELVVDGALASTRVAQSDDLAALLDGASISFPAVTRGDGWWYRVQGSRSGVLVTLQGLAERRAANGSLIATRRASLMLVRRGADTLRVLGSRPRF